jgi:amino acid adenylation domain-containing protein
LSGSAVADRLAGLSREQRALLFEQLRKRREQAAAPPETIPRRPPEPDPPPASFAQERLWLIDRLQPGLPTYNIPLALRIEGEARPAVLRAVLGEIVRRHEVLRTTFREADGRPSQVIAPPGRWELPLVDLSALPEDLRQETARRLAQEEAERPFDLERGPLLRATLLRLAPAGHALLLNLHHIIADGWSLGVLVREITALYGAALTGAPSPLPGLPVQYADFAVWQRGWLQGETLERQLAYWRQALAGLPPSLDLPADRPVPAERTQAGARFRAPLDRELARGVAALARRFEATPFAVLLAAFQALLARLTGASDLAVGSPIANRNRMEIEPLIGFFVNTLVLRAELGDDPPFRELVARARKSTLEAYAHQDLPFERLVEELRPERQLAVNPLFQVLFALQNAPVGAMELPGLTLSPLPFETRSAQFDLEVSVWEGEEGMAVDVVYSAERFDPPTPRRWIGYLETLLRGLAANPELRLSEAPLLSRAEWEQVVLDWNDTRREIADVALAHEIVARQAALTPETAAVEHGEERLSYRELLERARSLATALRGVAPDEPVALWVGRTLALPVAVLGVLEAGGACLPLDPSYPEERLALMLADAAPRIVVAEEGLAAPEGLFAGLEVISIGDRGDFAGAGPVPAREGAGLSPDHLAYILYTSGSTGRPKGVALPHRALVNLAAWAREVRPEPGRRVLQFSPLGFDVSFEELFSTWGSGGTLVLMPEEARRDPQVLLSFLIEKRIERVFQPFVALQQLAEAARERGRIPEALRELVTAGEQLRITPAVAALCRGGVRLFNEYGPTETHVTTAHLLEGDPAGWPALPPIGRPLANHRALLLDRARNPVPVGVPGELCVGGVGVARGYFRRPDLTAERFIPDPTGVEPGARLYRTGDLARWTPGGDLEYLGRTDFQVKIRGYRVEPGEVEATVVAHPGVRDAAVVARSDRSDRSLVAYVVWEGEADEAGLRGALKAALPAAMVPAAFVALEALPLTPSGKVDRRALAGPAFAPEGPGTAATAYVEPATETERELAAVWSEILGIERAGGADDFFDLGGHSLLATRLVSRVRQAFGVELPLRAVFEAPTLAAFAARVDRERGSAILMPPVRPVPRDRPLPLSFAQERLWFVHLVAPESPVYNLGAAMRLAGRLDTAALAAALGEVLRRHEALRTTFRATAKGAVQEVHPWAPLAQPLIDLSGLPAAARGREARRITAQESARPFDLERGPLLRALLLRLDPEDHVALWTTHHITADGWSLTEVFVPELTRLYAAALAGRLSPLPEPAVQYADYAVWQRDWLRGEVLAEQLGYWSRELAGLAPLDLPADRPRPPVPSGRGGTVSWELPPARTEALGRLARAGEATLFMVLFAAFAAALHRETGAAALPVGLPVANRSRSEIEGLIGFFVNTLVLRGDLSGDPDLSALLARARATVLGALSHQDIPFERLVDELRLPRNPHRPPLLRVTFQLQTATTQGPLELPGVTLTPFEAGAEAAKFDLVVNLFETAGGLTGYFLYDADLFDAATIARLAGHFGVLLSSWIDTPALRLSGLPLLTPAERHHLLVEWNPVPVPEGARFSLHRRFEAQADRAPEATALSADGEHLSYAQLDAWANRIARHLQASGVRPGDRVALRLERSAGMVAAILGVLKAGAAYVPVDPAYPEERIAFTLEDSGAALVLTPEALAAADRQSGERLEIPADPDLPAYVIYTSGSTGRPKGVVVTHANVDRLFTSTGPWFDFGPGDVWTLFHSYAFDFSVWEIWGALLHGGRLVVVPYWVSRSPEAFHELLRSERVTVLNQTPSAFRQLIWASEGKPADLPLRYVVFGGEALEPASLAPWIARYGGRPRLINMYGITETTVHVTYRPVGEGDLAAGSRIGAPIPDLAVHLLDPALQPVPVGAPGEIHVGGAGLALGYLGRPDLTAERFIPDPFSGRPGARLYRSGDLARRLPDGDLEYLGRADQQVKIRGFRIELGEVEAALAGQPGVREAVVLARSDGSDRSDGSVRLVAYIVGDAADPAALRQALGTRLPDYMIPAAFVFLEALPLTGNGKVDRRALPAPEAAVPAAADRREPRDPLERFLAAQMLDVLGLPADRETGIDESFFDLGGNSITSAIFTHRLQEAVGEAFHVMAIFDHPTVAALAAYIRERHPEIVWSETGPTVRPRLSGRGALVPLQTGSPGRRPLFCIHSVGGEIVAYRELARGLGADQPVWGFQTPDPPIETIEEMAARYIADARTVQPEGPYWLAGWSMGAAVIYEMARQWEAEGERTAILAVIDAVSPTRSALEPVRSDTELLGLFALALADLHEVDVAGLDLPPELRLATVDLSQVDLSGLDVEAALDITLDLGRQAGLLPPSLDRAELRRLFERFRANRAALSAYQPGPYGGEVHLMRAMEQPEWEDDPNLGWEDLTPGRVRIIESPGDHHSILLREAAALAARLRGLMGE